jgi:raffinose/stachyose/melibiose transport system substrate-binding protein
MKNDWRFLVGAPLLALMLLGSMACKKKGDPGAGAPVEIKFLHKWPQPANMAYFDAVVKAFETANPGIKVKMEAVADEPIKDKLRVLMGSESQPDVYFSWSGEFAKKFVTSSNAYDLTEALNADPGWRDGFMKAGLEPFTFSGKNYGIPLRINGKFFVYNKELFDKYKLAEPANWEQFMTVCETLKKAGVAPIAFGNITPWAACHYLTGLNQKLVPQDVRERDYNPKTGEYTDPGYIKALQYFKGLNDKGYFNKGVNSTEHNMALETFAQGKQAMLYVELEEFQDVNTKMAGKPWGFFPLPAIEGAPGNQKFLTGAPDGFMVSAKTAHPKEAIAFLKFLTSRENAAKLVATLGWPSPVVGAVNSGNAPDFLVKGMEGVQKAEGMALWLDTDINIKISDVYLPDLQELLNGTKTPQQIMKEVQAVAKQVASEAK